MKFIYLINLLLFYYAIELNYKCLFIIIYFTINKFSDISI